MAAEMAFQDQVLESSKKKEILAERREAGTD
jgi:hypothetical protein